MVDLQSSGKNIWLSLGEACRLLEVNESTLRQWGDSGHVQVYRTPGGHRRFLRDDVMRLTSPSSPTSDGESREKLEGSALRRIRRRLNHEEVARQSWYQSVEEEGRGRMRLFGRRLLSLLLQEGPLRRRRQDFLEESLLLGHEYGTEMADRGVPLEDSVEAFIFFRTLVLDSTSTRSWSQILELADQVLVGMVESYQKRITQMDRGAGNVPASPSGIRPGG
jgi:excisionase family DNA binding protein